MRKLFDDAEFLAVICPNRRKYRVLGVKQGEGLFVYSPVLLLAIPALGLVKQKGRSVWLPWVMLTGTLGLQVLVYDQNWWSITWGTRFLLPVIPLLAIAALPVIDLLARRGGRWFFWGFISLAVCGLVIQLGRVLISDIHYLKTLYAQRASVYPAPFLWDLAYAPFWRHWKLIFSGADFDLTLAMIDMGRTQSEIILIGGVLMVTVIGLAGGFRMRPIRARLSRRILNATAASLTFLVWVVSFFAAQKDPMINARPLLYAGLDEVLSQELASGEPATVIVVDYLSPLWFYSISFGNPQFKWYSWPAPESPQLGQPSGLACPHQLMAKYASEAGKILVVGEALPGVKTLECIEEMAEYIDSEFVSSNAAEFVWVGRYRDESQASENLTSWRSTP